MLEFSDEVVEGMRASLEVEPFLVGHDEEYAHAHDIFMTAMPHADFLTALQMTGIYLSAPDGTRRQRAQLMKGDFGRYGNVNAFSGMPAGEITEENIEATIALSTYLAGRAEHLLILAEEQEEEVDVSEVALFTRKTFSRLSTAYAASHSLELYGAEAMLLAYEISQYAHRYEPRSEVRRHHLAHLLHLQVNSPYSDVTGVRKPNVLFKNERTEESFLRAQAAFSLSEFGGGPTGYAYLVHDDYADILEFVGDPTTADQLRAFYADIEHVRPQD